jgi:bifunctional non-homologous end joining protein LigD
VPTGAGWFHEIKQFVIDGEAVILCVDGIADFNALHSGKQNGAVQLCAFDVLAIDGGDVRDLPLSMHKGVTWTGYSAAVPTAFFINPFEIGDIGPELFRAACNMGWRGLTQSAAIGHTAVGRRTGSRPRTAAARR